MREPVEKNLKKSAQEGVINSWARLSEVSGHRDVTESEACDEHNFRKWRCYCFSCEHFELIFFREWSSNMVSLLIEDTITSYANGRGKCILITTWKFCKKGVWSVLVSLQVRKIMWVRCGISLDKNSFFCKWLKSMRKLVASLQSSLYLTESI